MKNKYKGMITDRNIRNYRDKTERDSVRVSVSERERERKREIERVRE